MILWIEYYFFTYTFMYFLKQIKDQFLQTLFLRAWDGESAGPFIPSVDLEAPTALPPLSRSIIDDLSVLWKSASLDEFIEQFNEQLNNLDLEERFISTQLTILLNGLRPIAEGTVPWYSPADEGYQSIRATVHALQRIHTQLQEDGNQLNVLIQGKLQEHLWTIQSNIWVHGEILVETEVQDTTEPNPQLVDAPLEVLTPDIDRTAHEYTTEEINLLTESVEKEKNEFRQLFFLNIIGEADNGQDISQLLQHPNVLSLIRQSNEGFEYWYDIETILQDFLNVQYVENSDIQIYWENLSWALEGYQESTRDLNILIRDKQSVWETTFWEERLRDVHEWYERLLENEEIKNALTNRDGTIPLFEDLWMDHINILREKWVNMAELFLVQENSDAYLWEELTVWSTFIASLSSNNDFASNLDFSFIDTSAQDIEIDGVRASFNSDGVRWAWYYDENNNQVLLQDGSSIKVISRRVVENDDQAVRDAVDERLRHLWTNDTQRRAYNEALRRDPDATFRGETLPWGVLWAILALLQNFFSGKNFEYNAQTGQWEDTSWGEWSWVPATNGEVVWAYTWGMELWSLSAEFESSSQWAHAYNPNDNGHGPSYGTYQMNTEVGVYRSFIQKHWITPGREWWNAAIQEHGLEAFQKMEHDHIKENNYDPMMNRITIPWKENFTLAMQNVIWSIGVQHGPWHSGILAVINNSWATPWDRDSEATLINALYDKRWQVYPPGISSRYNRERVNALAMLQVVTTWDIYNQNIGEIPSWIQSSPAETNPETGVTLCSKTARINLANLWVQSPNSWSSAKASFEIYPSERISVFPPVGNSEAKVADFYLDASSTNAQFGHRVAAFQQNGQWFVLDPYYPVPWYESNRRWPIRAEDYVSYMRTKSPPRELWWAAYFS